MSEAFKKLIAEDMRRCETNLLAWDRLLKKATEEVAYWQNQLNGIRAVHARHAFGSGGAAHEPPKELPEGKPKSD